VLGRTPTDADIAGLSARAQQIRRHVIEMLAAAGSGHPGGSLSAADLMSCLYFGVMRHRPEDPQWPDRDRFLLSKGHACPALYGALAEAGYVSRDLLTSLRRFGSPLQGHPDRRRLGAVEASTGSLGLGLSIGVGMALAARLRKSPSRTYVMLGDGESEEGLVWEAALMAAHHGLDSLCAVVDFNRRELDASVKALTDLEPLAAKWRAFNWHAVEVDGHDHRQILGAFAEAASTRGRPTVLVASTVKGKGVSFMEKQLRYHANVPDTPALVAQALREIDASAGPSGGAASTEIAR
jgi:transketolase